MMIFFFEKKIPSNSTPFFDQTTLIKMGSGIGHFGVVWVVDGDAAAAAEQQQV